MSKHIWSSERGATYLTLMMVIVLMGISMSAAGTQWRVVMKREREAELAFRGVRIKTAIEAYAADYQVKKATRSNKYPLSLVQLSQLPKRHLQVVYKDPITDKDFDLIMINGEVRGVKSSSPERPLDQVRFKEASAYNQILFQAEQSRQSPSPCGSVPNPNPLNPLAPPVSATCPASNSTPSR